MWRRGEKMLNDKQRWKKRLFPYSLLLLVLLISALTNPTREDFIKFDEADTGVPIPESVRIAEANFFFFSIYAPTHKDTIDEYGIIHLGFMGHFFKVTNGQYDVSIWERFLK
jgi:hypothetical protein